MSPIGVLETSVGMPDFETLVAHHQGAVCAVAYAILRDRGRSEEIAQEAFLVAWQKLPGMSPQPSLPAWVCGIARNLARNAARRRRETEMTDVASDQHSALDDLLARERAALANQALTQLSIPEREAVVMYYRTEESLPAVAAALGISTEAAKKRVQRGRSHLRDALEAVQHELRHTRPGAAFTAGCVAALAIDGARSAAAAAATPVKATAAKLALAGIAIAVVATTAVVVARRDGATAPMNAPSRVSTSTAGMVRPLAPAARAAAVARIEATRAQRAPVTTTTTTTTPAAAQSTVFPGLAPADRVYDFAGSALATPIPPLARPLPAVLGKRELRAAIGAVQPLIRDCYAQSGETRKNALEFVVRLESDAGSTIATEARLDGPLASNAELAVCVRESLLSIELADFDVDGSVDIGYLFTL